MPPTVTAATATAHPILVEVIETRLMWIEADTLAQAAQQATAFANDVVGAANMPYLPLVDVSLETRAVTEVLADWLDADPDQVERLDAYFAAHSNDRTEQP